MLLKKYLPSTFAKIEFALRRIGWYLSFLYYRYLRDETITESEVLERFDNLTTNMPDEFIAGIFGSADIETAARKFMTWYSRAFNNFYPPEIDQEEFTAAVGFYADFLQSPQLKRHLSDRMLEIMAERGMSKVDMYFCIRSHVKEDYDSAQAITNEALDRASKNLNYPAEEAFLTYWVNRHPEYRGLELQPAKYPDTHQGLLELGARSWRLNCSVAYARTLTEEYMKNNAADERRRPEVMAAFIEQVKSLFPDDLMLELTECQIAAAKLTDRQLTSFFRGRGEDNIDNEKKRLTSEIIGRFVEEKIPMEKFDECRTRAAAALANRTEHANGRSNAGQPI